MQIELSQVQKALGKARRVLIACHVNPDGDAVGSSVALAHIVLYLGGDARLLFLSPLPDFLRWLPIPVPVVPNLAALEGWVPDLLIFADCGDADRAGEELSALARKIAYPPGKGWEDVHTVNIDHHSSNPGFADINWVEPDRCATGELAGMLAESLGIPLEGELGEAIYLALVSDTGNFSFSNTSADCLALASRIVNAGLDIGSFTQKSENNWNINRMHLWGKLLQEISLHADGAVALSVVPRRYLDELGLGKASLDGFAAWLRRLKGVRVGVFIREDRPGYCKISLRSMGDVDVQSIAAVFGGGGHKAAAGAELAAGPGETVETVLAEVLSRLQADNVSNSHLR